jgi:hypothetical protein
MLRRTLPQYTGIEFLFLALLAARDHLETGGQDAGISFTGLSAAGTALLGNFAPAASRTAELSLSGGGLLLDDAARSLLLSADELFGKVSAVHGRRVCVDRVSDQASIQREDIKSGLEGGN